ncbi:MAG: rhomboid family intramembrane serine protease [Anaerolineales bacterium]
MFPIGDTDVRDSGPAIITTALLILNTIAFGIELTVGVEGIDQLFRQYGVVPAQIGQGRQLYSLFTSMFLHGGWMHLISNMVFLMVFGDNIEAVLGKIGYLLFYLGGGIAASVTHIVVNWGSSMPSVGASGAIAAILGAYVVMFPRSRIKVLYFSWWGIGITRITAIVFLGFWALMQFLNGVAALGAETAQTGGVAVWAHIGGFVAGLVIGFLFKGQAQKFKTGQRGASRTM